MSTDDKVSELGRFEYGIVRRKVKQIIGRAGFRQQDSDWLQQQLLLRILQSLQSFNPALAHRNVFVTAVVERCVCSLLRDQQAAKRDHRRVSSLNVMIKPAEDGPIEWSGAISQRDLDAQRGRHPRSDLELTQLMLDVADEIAKLPDDLRDLAERLKTQSVSEIARDTGVPRTTLNELVSRLRRRFEKAGLKDYL